MGNNEPSRIGTFESIGSDVVTPNVPRFAWHTAALANPSQIGKTLIVHPSDPEEGWFRTRDKDGPWQPLVLWQDGGQWFALRGIEPDRRAVNAVDIWTWCARYPISFDVYEAVAERGEPWPDVDQAVHAQRRGPPRPGSNEGGLSESELLAGDIQAALDQMRLYKAIDDDETAGKAQSLRARLNELSGKADKVREKLVRPHLDAQRDINGEWQPLVKDAKGGADTLRKTLEAYETKKLRERRAAEEAARKAEAEAELSFVAPTAPEPAAVAPAPSTQVRGAYGKAAAVRAKNVVTAITNPIELFKFVAGDPRVEALLMKLAQESVDAGHTVPGVVVEEQAKVS